MFPIEQSLEFSFAAFRVNGGYNKTNGYDPNGRVFRFSNKEIVYYMSSMSSKETTTTWIPETFVPVEVTDEDRENVKELHKFFRRYTMLVFGDSLNQFQKDMYAVYSKEKVSSKDLGFVAYIPQFFKNESSELAYKKALKDSYSESKHFLDKQVIGVAEILKRIYLKDYGIFLYIAGVNGNLVNFTKNESIEVGSVYSIRAKVKASDFERETRLPMTKLNYVKLEMVEET